MSEVTLEGFEVHRYTTADHQHVIPLRQGFGGEVVYISRELAEDIASFLELVRDAETPPQCSWRGNITPFLLTECTAVATRVLTARGHYGDDFEQARQFCDTHAVAWAAETNEDGGTLVSDQSYVQHALQAGIAAADAVLASGRLS